ncbi:O-antigen ligase family protein [Bradyrhizobium sp. NP1]|uniref:O-antigen ligase family protein n=1 Tax=Bradyrhizobium sp. NP1 TaxID=3049772 RepID=UPI0025A64026|nr:O-antigen ligase family protein [Bradyrhizobium sp. NP1]WJR76307.1 O-antigen ligase family protein [Bradyrhizobium sp. NP1]
MTTIAGNSTITVAASRWRDPAAWRKAADVVAILTAASLPWSTSATGILGVVLLITIVPALDWPAFLQSLKRPASALPIALFLLAVVGILWSDAAWGARLHGISPVAKLLMLPLLLFHFERSERGLWVCVAFLVSCVLLMCVSWVVAFHPELTLKANSDERGIFVKDYINQSQEFTLCAVALAYPIMQRLREGKIWTALLLGLAALSLVANMVFVVVARTALVAMPLLLAVFAVRHLRWRTTLAIAVGGVALAVLAWLASPELQSKTASFATEYKLYREQGQATSIGLRLEFWRKSAGFIAEAPLVGHGTGSTRGLFEQAVVGTDAMASGQVVGNPHNQTLNVAVQWGAIGVILLYAMWLSHLLLFRGEGLIAWIGLAVVLQNILSSLFNSHLFDFHEGWMYVLGVGVAGGMVSRLKETGRESHATGA